ncbi:MAG: AMP-binding protein [Planctomycetes bacterium]|nr:AMP-binding protein [Planctomycetota bacterium]
MLPIEPDPRGQPEDLAAAFRRVARARSGEVAVLDSRGARLTFGELSQGVSSLAARLAGRLPSEARPGGESVGMAPVGVLLPPGAAGAQVNLALAAMGRASVNLNPLTGAAGLAAQTSQAGVSCVITARAALEALGGANAFPGQVLWVEDLLEALPSAGTEATSHESGDPARRVATVLFSSGSTSRPKAIQLSHANVLFNARAVAAAFEFGPGDRLLGVLPLFHSFGYTVTVWAPLLAGAAVIFHDNPFDARAIGELAREHRASVLLATPAMYQAWMRRVEPPQLSHVRASVVGAQRLDPSLASAWRARYGSELYEGYGCTELSPVVSANLPDVPEGPGAPGRMRRRQGSVGRPLPGVEVEIRDPATGQVLPAGVEGDVWVRGPGVMLGYLGDEQATRQAVVDGWYDTQDVGKLDVDGFLLLTDRRSRFSKLGGEMVSHGAVETALIRAAALLGASPESFSLAVTAVADPGRGERLVVVHTALGVELAAVIERARKEGLPNLCAPRAEHGLQVAALPFLGTGKLDLARLKRMAAGD